MTVNKIIQSINKNENSTKSHEAVNYKFNLFY